MAARERILDVARSHLGELEVPRNSNLISFSYEYGIPGYAWCAAFVSSIYKEAGYPLPDLGSPTSDGFVYVPAGIGYARSNGQAVEVGQTPLPGDIVMFSWDGHRFYPPEVGDHTAILESWSPGTVTCVEGNTTPGADGNQGDGGGVYRRTRSESLVACYWRPAVLDGDSFAPAEPLAPEPARRSIPMDLDIRRYTTGGIVVDPPNYGITDSPIVYWDAQFVPKDSTVVIGPRTPELGRFQVVIVASSEEKPVHPVAESGWGDALTYTPSVDTWVTLVVPERCSPERVRAYVI